MKAIERLLVYLELNKIKPTRYEKMVGLSNGYIGKQIKNNSDIGSEILDKILKHSSEINPNWLVFGELPMLKPPKEDHSQPNISNNNVRMSNSSVNIGSNIRNTTSEDSEKETEPIDDYRMELILLKSENQSLKNQMQSLENQIDLLKELNTILKDR